ncbi:PRA1 family protein E-like [Tripterygium wilfordii]|uniref:PRA1 family protein n=1 Tax=Tripterygium wilfordii TaxID=458696 RepID=A0A7J7CYE3_TRIWF|nr:PRA1 family protein F2-like [Tripterygium wilfordii]KAF5738896.1 PRA1 family protein E-like [Tripterygium wilfordii]
MKSTSSAPYGAIPSSTTPPTTTNFLTRATANTRAYFASRRQWTEFFNLSSFTRPHSFGEATVRLKRNLNYFRGNYAMIILGILFLSLLWHPLSLIVYIIIFVAWFFLYFFRDEPLVIVGRTVDDRIVLGVLSVVTVVVLVFTSVWLNVLVSILIGAFLVVLHAAIRGTEDLYMDDLEGSDGRLFSVLESPTRAGYSRV